MANSAFSQDSSAVINATYITTEDETGSLTNSFSLGSLTTGLILNTVAAGVSTITKAAEGTDYWAPGGTDVAVADGGTGASTAGGARTNLGLVIGTDVQAYDATLQSISALGTAADKMLYTTGIDTWAEADITSGGRDILSSGVVQYDNLGSEVLPSSYQLAIGSSPDAASAVVSSDGATVTLTYQKSGGGDMIANFSGGPVDIDCTPALTIALTAGTDTAPTLNYVYITKAAPTVLTKSTVSYPTAEEFLPVGTFIIPSAATTQTYGAYKTHLWSDDLWRGTTENGHLSHLNTWIRSQNASWISGANLTPTLTPASPDTLTIAVATGIILQLHDHDFPAFDSSGGGSTNLTTFFVVNKNGAAYDPGKDLYNFLELDDGTAVANNERLSWVVWGVVSEDSGDCKIFVNLPSGVYLTDAGAINDSNRYANYTIPSSYKGTGFLIARLTYKYTTAAGGTLTFLDQEDLRGTFPNTSAGGTSIAGATTELDNLGTTAINANLTPDTDVTYDFGSLAFRWNNLYAATLGTGDTAADTLLIQAYDVDGASATTFITLTANNDPTCALSGDVTGVTQAPSDNSTKLATTAYADAAATAVSGANTALSNLAAVAINTSLISDTDVTDDLGSQSTRWNNIYSATLRAGETATDTLVIGAYDVDGTAWTPFITLTSANDPTCVLASGVTATTQSASDNSTKLATTAYVDTAVGAAGGALTLLSNATASSDATIDFDNVFDSTYDAYKIVISEFISATDGVAVYCRIGTGATPTYQTSSYKYISTSNASPGTSSASAAQIILTGGVSLGSTDEEMFCARMVVYSPSTSRGTMIVGDAGCVNSAGTQVIMTNSAQYNSTTAVTSIQFYCSSGNIESGYFQVYGLQKS